MPFEGEAKQKKKKRTSSDEAERKSLLGYQAMIMFGILWLKSLSITRFPGLDDVSCFVQK